MVRLTPNGLSVRSRQRAISLVRSSGVGWVSAVIKPSAPALATAATSSARPTHCMPPCTIGCSTPTSSVKRVLIMCAPECFLRPALSGRRPLWFFRGRMPSGPAKVYRAAGRQRVHAKAGAVVSAGRTIPWYRPAMVARCATRAITASSAGVGIWVRRPISCTTATSGSISIGRPRSRSCSIEVLCAPTLSAPSIRRSTSTRNLTPKVRRSPGSPA